MKVDFFNSKVFGDLKLKKVRSGSCQSAKVR